jgi:hypothetical protein
MWPDSHPPKIIAHATADGTDKPKAETVQKDLDKLVKAAQNLPDSLSAEKEAELNNQFGQFEFTETPLTEVLEYFHDAHHTAEYYIDAGALKDAGIDPTATKVTISFKHVRLKTFLDLMLSPFNLGYHFRDGIMVITTKEKLDATLETRVYDCREILAVNTDEFRKSSFTQTHKLGGGGFDIDDKAAEQQSNNKSSAEPAHQSSAKGKSDDESADKKTAKDGDVNGSSHSVSADQPRTTADDLIDVITTSIAPQSWNQQGGPGTICEYDGLLIISADPKVQSQVADLLDKLSARLASRSAK